MCEHLPKDWNHWFKLHSLDLPKCLSLKAGLFVCSWLQASNLRKSRCKTYPKRSCTHECIVPNVIRNSSRCLKMQLRFSIAIVLSWKSQGVLPMNLDEPWNPKALPPERHYSRGESDALRCGSWTRPGGAAGSCPGRGGAGAAKVAELNGLRIVWISGLLVWFSVIDIVVYLFISFN